MSLLMEFAVKMTCQSCVKKVEESLTGVEGLNIIDLSLEKGTVLVETSLPSSVVQERIESSGKVAVLKGYGSQSQKDGVPKAVTDSVTAAVAMLGGTIGYGLGVKGVVRFVQRGDDCVIDGTVDGLSPGYHGLHIHECGDITEGCNSVGQHFDLNGGIHGGPDDTREYRHTGDLGNITAGKDGRAVFRITDKFVKVWDIIGRSIVVTSREDDLGKGKSEMSPIDGNSGERLACGIISRSAGLFENDKKICACDGVTIWDERNRPLAGPGRKVQNGNSLIQNEDKKTCTTQ
ncbi:copper chaperone for superoxide dismutase [Cimex lectularius]|uniref:Extracellular superoxide dismutase [Cu-Zn] n=1 Tax=Cimex lectularius TaxID=79782 RepID=A0A8I6RXF9_CIMLE|nr:copper chaperone for superoxide dismutase [Cimex lectularius]